MFIIEGLPAIGWAFLFRHLVDDRPEDAAWLSDDERSDIEETIAAEQRELPEPRGFRQVARSPNVLVLSAQYLLWSVGVYGLVFWLPSIVKHLTGQGIGTTGLLTAVPYAAAAIAMIAVSAALDRRAHRRVFTWIPLLISAICFAVSYLTRGGTFTTAFILLIIAAASCTRHTGRTSRTSPSCSRPLTPLPHRHDQRIRCPRRVHRHVRRGRARRRHVGRAVRVPRRMPVRRRAADVCRAPSRPGTPGGASGS